MSPLIALFLAVTVGFVVEATAGFGATVVSVTLASAFLPIEEVLAALVPVNLAFSSLLLARVRSHVDRRVLLRDVVAWMLPGMVVGLALFSLRDQAWIKTVFAAFVVALAGRELWTMARGEGPDLQPLGPARRVSALLGAGVIHGLFSCGGPLLVYAVGRELPDKARFRATLSATWVGLNTLLVGRYLLAGTLTRETLPRSALLLVPLGIGLVVGQRIHDRLDPRRFRVAVFALLFFAGLSLLVRSL